MLTDPPPTDAELRLMTRAARLYYGENQTQADVGKHLGVSRATASRLLIRARAEGIVEIAINDPFETDTGLTDAARDALGVEVVVATGGRSASPDLVRHRLGAAAARHIQGALQPSDRVGLGWGRTLHETAQALQATALPVRLVPLLGGLGQVSPSFQVHEIAGVFAERLGASWTPLYVPAIVPHAPTHEALMQSPDVQQIVGEWSSLSVALVGIGDVAMDGAVQMLFSSYLTSEVRRGLARGGAVGDICMHFFDEHGRPVPEGLTGLMAASWDQLAAIPTVIAVAGGVEKAAAIVGACRGGLVDVLITDESAARAVTEMVDHAT